MKNEGVHRDEVRALRICDVVRRSTVDRPRLDPSAQADIAQSEPRFQSPGGRFAPRSEECGSDG
jgi:hypothetical protein